MNTALMTPEEKKNYAMQQNYFNQECRRTSLQIATTMHPPSMEDLIGDAEIIYQWLIKTEA